METRVIGIRPCDLCPFCLEEIKYGVPENGICEHRELLKKYPHLRFNASDYLSNFEIEDSKSRFASDVVGVFSRRR